MKVKKLSDQDKTVLRIAGMLLAGASAMILAVWFAWGADGTWDAVGAVVWTLIAQSWVRGAIKLAIVLGDQQIERMRAQRERYEREARGEVWE